MATSYTEAGALVGMWPTVTGDGLTIIAKRYTDYRPPESSSPYLSKVVFNDMIRVFAYKQHLVNHPIIGGLR